MSDSGDKQINETKSEDDSENQTFFIESKRALLGGLLAAAIALFGQWIIGQVYGGYEARKFLEAMSSAAHYLGSSVVTASATILALMLTLISLVNQADKTFERSFFKRVERIGFLATIELIGGILLLLCLSIPFSESDEVPSAWFTGIYYVLMAFLAILSGLLVTIVLMLLNTITSTIDAIRPSKYEEEKRNGSSPGNSSKS